MTNSPMDVARRPTLKSPFLPWMVLMANWPERVIMGQLLLLHCERRQQGPVGGHAVQRGCAGTVASLSESAVTALDARASSVVADTDSGDVSSVTLGSAL